MYLHIYSDEYIVFVNRAYR